MSSSYSPDLRIELIGTGDQAGVWGATTNTNLEYVIEPAVAGYISVAVASANQALTYINGGSAIPGDNQAVHAAIALTTSTGANFAVYVPPASKLYTFYNASSYTATVYCSTSIGDTNPKGTGIAIPAGKTMSVWSDGTNVAQQNDHLISPTMSSPAMSGTPTAPTASTGTNTTQVATTAFIAATLLASVYPVGSIYTNASVATNPGTLLGFGTWTAFGAGRVAVGFDSGNTLFDTAEETGGYADAITVSHSHTFSTTTGSTSTAHTHAITDPGHSHTVTSSDGYQLGTYPQSGGTSARQISNGDLGLKGNFYYANSATTGITGTGAMSANETHTHSVSGDTGSTGSSGTNRNYQPYITVYMWKRTA